MSAGGAAAIVLVLFATYSVHAAIWTAGASIARSWVARPSLRSSLWRLALFGALSSTAASAVMSGRVVLSRHVVFDAVSGKTASWVPPFGGARARTVASPHSDGSAPVRTRERLDPGKLSPWTTWLAAALAGAALLGMLRLAFSATLLRRSLRQRKLVKNKRLRRRFRRICLRFGMHDVALTQSATLVSPMVLGRREVCLPTRTVAAMKGTEIDAVFSHELAHLERSDGVWFPLVACVEAALWMHPLTRWVVHRFRQDAELACDERAVAVTGDPRALARALVQVAEMVSERQAAIVPGMARPGQRVERVKRLMTQHAALASSVPGPSVALAPPRPERAADGGKGLCTFLGLCLLGWASPSLGLLSPESRAAEPRSEPPREAAAKALEREHRARRSELASEVSRLRDALVDEENQQQAARLSRPASPRVLELRQELRHAIAERRWRGDELRRANKQVKKPSSRASATR